MNHSLMLSGALITISQTELAAKDGGGEPRQYVTCEVSVVASGSRYPMQLSISLQPEEVPPLILQKAATGELMYKPVTLQLTSITARQGRYANAAPRLVISGHFLELDGKPMSQWEKLDKPVAKEPVKAE